jgi:hypothetical protein
MGYSPAVDLVDDTRCAGSTVEELKELGHPFDEVIFEDALDQLMQQIRGDQFPYVGPREIRCIWLARLGNKARM